MYRINVFKLSNKDSNQNFIDGKEAYEKAIEIERKNPNIKTEVVIVMTIPGA